PLSRMPETHQEYGPAGDVRYARVNIFVPRNEGRSGVNTSEPAGNPAGRSGPRDVAGSPRSRCTRRVLARISASSSVVFTAITEVPGRYGVTSFTGPRGSRKPCTFSG